MNTIQRVERLASLREKMVLSAWVFRSIEAQTCADAAALGVQPRPGEGITPFAKGADITYNTNGIIRHNKVSKHAACVNGPHARLRVRLEGKGVFVFQDGFGFRPRSSDAVVGLEDQIPYLLDVVGVYLRPLAIAEAFPGCIRAAELYLESVVISIH
jgi:hypothetical protein